MRALRNMLVRPALAVAMAACLFTAGAQAAEEHIKLPEQHWHSSGMFGTVDLPSAQRGYQVYRDVCAACHGMKQLAFRDLTGLGFTDAQARALAAAVTVPLGLNDQGEPREGPGLLSSRFPAPWPNETAARARYNGAVPPDLSVMVKAREGGPDYIYALMTGYGDPPAGLKMGDGMNYNKYFPGHQIAMPAPLSDGKVEYADGTKATVDQMARDVTEFLTWAANPEMVERKRMGIRVLLFLMLMTVVTYVVKRRVWADVH
jgi:ubiquinol-cytochrome c reductase cytochrome c1 subunit